MRMAGHISFQEKRLPSQGVTNNNTKGIHGDSKTALFSISIWIGKKNREYSTNSSPFRYEREIISHHENQAKKWWRHHHHHHHTLSTLPTIRLSLSLSPLPTNYTRKIGIHHQLWLTDTLLFSLLPRSHPHTFINTYVLCFISSIRVATGSPEKEETANFAHAISPLAWRSTDNDCFVT